MVQAPTTIDQINRYEVGNYPYLTELVTFIGGQPVKGQITLEQVTIERHDYEQALAEINETWGEIEDPETGKTYETAVVNLDAPSEDGFDIEFATEKSALGNNPGNAVEFAANSAVHPGRKRVYIASPGNGLSSDFEPEEHGYIRSTGRLIAEDGQPLPTFAGLARALEIAGLVAEPGVRMSANSAGGSYGRGLMTALPYDTVTHAYFKNIPGLTNHRGGVVWSTLAVVRDMLDDRKSSKQSQDAWKLTAAMIDQAKASTPNIYGPDSRNRQQTKIQQAQTSHSPSKLVTTALTLARGGEAKGDPAAADTAEALRKQPHSLVTNHFSLYDRLYSNREDMYRYLERTHGLGAVAADGQVEIVLMVMSGTHRDHTAYPHLRWSAESRAFSRIR